MKTKNGRIGGLHELHQLCSRHYAFEGRCFVLAVGLMMPIRDLPAELLGALDAAGPDGHAQNGSQRRALWGDAPNAFVSNVNTSGRLRGHRVVMLKVFYAKKKFYIASFKTANGRVRLARTVGRCSSNFVHSTRINDG